MLSETGESLEDGLEEQRHGPLGRPPAASHAEHISESELSCHCCYNILLDPITLTCGHSVCRHCLAMWWHSSKKNECPECREKWAGFPKINILLRDATVKLFDEAVRSRKAEVEADPQISRTLQAFQRYGNNNQDQPKKVLNKGAGFFFSGVVTALTVVAVLLLAYQWSMGGVEPSDLLLSKPVSHWSPQEVLSWLHSLGPWAHLYMEPFLQENVNGRLLLMLGEEELQRPPYSIESPVHRRTILAELDKVKSLGVKPPHTLWEYKAAYPGTALFLLYALKRSPRLALLYLYLFEYSDIFLPFLHTCCPAVSPWDQAEEDGLSQTQVEPNWKQWAEFLVKYVLLPYQLMAEFAWDWLSVHYWTSRFIIVNAMLLSVLEVCALWRLWTRTGIRALPGNTWSHLWDTLSQGMVLVLLWPITPHFFCNCLFYLGLYFSPILNIDRVVQQLLHPNTDAL
ncbi:bifunctional apoptosis regulator-like [Eucyclogobius newberryi]|uniref:bifunctional apoptosis regulator-like n=1 Tax=Eucyclogobius newberryi TaxID=166745 RepID=UPI003B597344